MNIRSGYDISIDELKVGTKRGQSYLPFKETALLNVLNHTLWFLPNVASCFAMANLLKQRQNTFYHSYKINGWCFFFIIYFVFNIILSIMTMS